MVRTAVSKTIYVGKGMQDKQTNRPRLAGVLNHKQQARQAQDKQANYLAPDYYPLQSAHLAFYVRPSMVHCVLACSLKVFTERYIFHRKFRSDFYKKCVESLDDDLAVKGPP